MTLAASVKSLAFNVSVNVGCASAIWFLGARGYGLALPLVVSLLWVLRQWRKQTRQAKIDVRQLLAREEKSAVLAKIASMIDNDGQLPLWVTFPDVERVEWLNQMLKQMWPYISQHIITTLKESVEPSVQANMPNVLKSFHFDKVHFGKIAPRIGGIKCHREHVSRDEIVLDLEIIYSSDCNIEVVVNRMKAGIADLQFHGHLRVVIKPLIPVIPMIGAMTIFFIQPPEIDFNLTNLADVLDLPGINQMLHNIINEQLSNLMVLPNRMPIVLSPDVDVNELKFPQPQGVVRVGLVEARDLKRADFSVVGKGKSDPYAMAFVGSQQFKTDPVQNTIAPKWNRHFEAIVMERYGQKLQLEIYDEDPGGEVIKDDFLGRSTVHIHNVAKCGLVDEWITLQNVETGQAHVVL